MAHDPTHGPSTRAVHAGSSERTPGAPVATPIYPSATFYSAPVPEGEVRYTRYGTNPNHLLQMMEAAMDHDGFSVIECLSECIEFYEGAFDAAVTFEEVAPVLQLFAQGLSGRALRLASASQAYTDTETLYLPQRIARGATREENFFRYKAMIALLWAQTRYGTYNADLQAVCGTYADPQRALEILNALETVRLDARLARSLPGLARDAARLRTGRAVDRRCLTLLKATATIDDSIALLSRVYDAPPTLEDVYPTVLVPAQAEKVRRALLYKGLAFELCEAVVDFLRSVPTHGGHRRSESDAEDEAAEEADLVRRIGVDPRLGRVLQRIVVHPRAQSLDRGIGNVAIRRQRMVQSLRYTNPVQVLGRFARTVVDADARTLQNPGRPGGLRCFWRGGGDAQLL